MLKPAKPIKARPYAAAPDSCSAGLGAEIDFFPRFSPAVVIYSTER